MCSYTAVTDLVIEADVARESSDIPLQKIKADVSSFKRANDSIAILRLKTPGNFLLRFLAGQAFLLTLPGGEHEVFPVASCPCDGNQLEFHINTRKDGAISGYISNNSPETGTSVVMHGPLGDFVLHTDSSRPLLLVAINEGFAQIKSLIESAVSIDKAEHFHLFWVTDKPDMNYMDNLCRSWADSLDNFDYTPLDCSAITECEQLVDMLKNNMKDIPDMKDHDIYVSAPRVILDTLVSRLHSMGLEDAHINCFDLDSLDSLKSPETPKIVIEQAGNNVGQS